MRTSNWKDAVTLPALLLTLPLMAGHGVAVAADPVGQDTMPCPGALAWLAAHPDESNSAMTQRDAARTFSDPALRADLAERFVRDQDARNAWIAHRGAPGLSAWVNRVDADNLQWLHRLVRRKGFPTVAQVGERGVRNAWLLLQHADQDPAFQAALLPVLMQRHADGELDGMTLSRFVDRVMVAGHQPQRYGTQFSPEAWATAHFGLPDEQAVQDVDDHRRALEIMPLADYVCMMSYVRRPRP